MNIKMLVTDIDGTLLPAGMEVPRRNVEAVQRAEQYCAGNKQPGIALLQKGSEIVHIGILAKSAFILLPPSSKILPPSR